MEEFELLFGIKGSSVQKRCVFVPVLGKGVLDRFGAKDLKKGKMFSSGQGIHCTLILTGIGASFVGDAVLYLERTACEEIILLGSCGLVEGGKGINVGDLVAPSSAVSLESFSQVLDQDFSLCLTSYPDEEFLKDFCSWRGARDVKMISCATFGSLKLEEENIEFLQERDIQAVDMECSAFFKAASHIKRKAIALFFVTDIIKEQPFFLADKEKNQAVFIEAVEVTKRFLSS